MTLQPGEPFSHYTIQCHIARGSTGDVYHAIDDLTGKAVALKIPSRATIVNPAQYAYFLRELDALQLLNHPAVQHFIESGRYKDMPFLVTDLINGPSLSYLIKISSPLPVDQAVGTIDKVAAGIAYCHANGVIHRDLKPDNIIVQADQPVIIDFGIALIRKRPTSGKPVGTPEYVAPEQVEGQRCDERTDIYTLGILLFELITGKPPFTSSDWAEVASMRLDQAAPRLDRVQPGVPLSVATIIAKCLQRAPNDRYPDVQALMSDLEHLDKVDSTLLERLTTPPPKYRFFQTQPGQALLTTAAVILGIALLTIVLIALKH